MTDEIERLLHQFNASIRPDKECRELIRTRRDVIVRAVNYEFRSINCSEHAIYVGSYGRNTATLNSDIDLAVILPEYHRMRFNGYSTNGQSALLQVVKNAISAHYSRTDIKGDGQIVSVKFSDGMVFEVLPAFETGDFNKSLYYPDTHSGGKWKTTDPRSEQKAISILNSLFGDVLYDLCRMIRVWNRYNNAGMSGYAIDATVCEFARCNPLIYTRLDCSHLVSAYMHFLDNNGYRMNCNIVGSTESIVASIDRNAVMRTIKSIDKADTLIRNHQTRDAINEWGHIFGPDFPII